MGWWSASDSLAAFFTGQRATNPPSSFEFRSVAVSSGVCAEAFRRSLAAAKVKGRLYGLLSMLQKMLFFDALQLIYVYYVSSNHRPLHALHTFF